MKNAINWFEIPAANFDRAVNFYGKILNQAIKKVEFQGMVQGIFSYDETGGVGGAITFHEKMKPSPFGTVAYLNVGKELSQVLLRIEKEGGKVIVPKTSIGEFGFYAIFTDSEGNSVGLHEHVN